MSIEIGDFVVFKFNNETRYGGRIQKINTRILGFSYDVDYLENRIMNVSDVDILLTIRPKFKVAEQVKLNCFAYPKYHNLKGTIVNITISPLGKIHYDVNFYKDDFHIEKVNFIKESLLEKVVTPNIDVKISNHIKIDKDGFCVTPKPIVKGDKEIVDDILDACKYVMREEKYDYDKYILGITKTPFMDSVKDFFINMEDWKDPNFKYYHFTLEDKKRLPDEVIFKDGKTTLLFSVKNDGKAPYNSFSSKVTKDDTFNKEFGFLVTYLKYLKENHKDILKEMFGFEQETENNCYYLHGIVRQILDENNIDFETYREYLLHILNNDRYTLKQYHDWKREIENKAKRYTEVVNEIESKEKELDKLKKQKENLK